MVCRLSVRSAAGWYCPWVAPKQSKDPNRIPAAVNIKAYRYRRDEDKKKHPSAKIAKAAQSSMAKGAAQCSSTKRVANREKPNQHTGRETFAEKRDLDFAEKEWSVALLLSSGRVT